MAQASTAGRTAPRLVASELYFSIPQQQEQRASLVSTCGGGLVDMVWYLQVGREWGSMADLSRRSPCNGGRAHRRDGAGPLGWMAPLGSLFSVLSPGARPAGYTRTRILLVYYRGVV